MGYKELFVIPRTSFNIQKFVYLYRGSTVFCGGNFLVFFIGDVVYAQTSKVLTLKTPSSHLNPLF